MLVICKKWRKRIWFTRMTDSWWMIDFNTPTIALIRDVFAILIHPRTSSDRSRHHVNTQIDLRMRSKTAIIRMILGISGLPLHPRNILLWLGFHHFSNFDLSWVIYNFVVLNSPSIRMNSTDKLSSRCDFFVPFERYK